MLHLICTVRETNYQPISRYKNNNSQLLDDTSWGELCSEEKRAAYQARGFDLEQLAKDYVYLVNRANT
ncbi:5-methyltetrahydropteroyltriglutamate--homocysteine S-methyltransferase [Glaesserella parasuis 174]|nr:5-methyltetrahydropteroyltriglutamate--homocysteine S-methyltransferase [Glaesserella parasuis 174]